MNADVYITADKTMYRVENSEIINQVQYPQHPFILYDYNEGKCETIPDDVTFILFKR